MDWQTLFLNANGRIGQKDFWFGFLILFVADIVLAVLGMIPLLGLIFSLASIGLIYCWVCVYSKRLHDFGKSGWLVAVPVGIALVLIVLSMITGAMAMFAGHSSAAGAAVALTGVALLGLVGFVGGLVMLAFLLWVGLSKPSEGDNAYGAHPTVSLFEAVTAAASAASPPPPAPPVTPPPPPEPPVV